MSLHSFSGWTSGPQQKKKRKKKEKKEDIVSQQFDTTGLFLQFNMVLPSGTACNHHSVTTENALAPQELRGQLCLQPENSIFKYQMQKNIDSF